MWRTLSQDLTPGVVGAVWAAVADVRAEVWARSSATTGNDPVVSDIDAWLVEIHSENKEGSAAGLVTVTPGTSGRSGCRDAARHGCRPPSAGRAVVVRGRVRRHTGLVPPAEPADPAPARVSADDRRRFERQAAALRTIENDDEGTPEWRGGVVEYIDAERAKRGTPPLKTEDEFHHRARELGLTR